MAACLLSTGRANPSEVGYKLPSIKDHTNLSLTSVEFLAIWVELPHLEDILEQNPRHDTKHSLVTFPSICCPSRVWRLCCDNQGRIRDHPQVSIFTNYGSITWEVLPP